jgi:hypothetical protein
MIAIVFQSVFRLEKYQNIFFVFLNLFLTSAYKNDPKNTQKKLI